MRVCSTEGCERDARTKGLCGMHYLRLWKHGDPLCKSPPPKPRAKCSVPGCDNPHHAKGLCSAHIRAALTRDDADGPASLIGAAIDAMMRINLSTES